MTKTQKREKNIFLFLNNKLLLIFPDEKLKFITIELKI